MSLSGKGKILSHVRGGVYLYISKDVASDSSFPFGKSENVKVTIQKNKVLIEKQ